MKRARNVWFTCLSRAPCPTWQDRIATRLAASEEPHILVVLLRSVRTDDLCAVQSAIGELRLGSAGRLQTVVVVPRRRDPAPPARSRPLPEPWTLDVCESTLWSTLEAVVEHDFDDVVLSAGVRPIESSASRSLAEVGGT